MGTITRMSVIRAAEDGPKTILANCDERELCHDPHCESCRMLRWLLEGTIRCEPFRGYRQCDCPSCAYAREVAA